MPNWEKSEINLIQALHKKLVRNKLREMITQRMHQCQYIRTKQLMPSTFVHHKWTVLEVFFQYKNQSCNTPIFFSLITMSSAKSSEKQSFHGFSG